MRSSVSPPPALAATLPDLRPLVRARVRAASQAAPAAGPAPSARRHGRSGRLRTLRRLARARTATLTAVALCALAANSLLARSALADASIDPGSFTAVRLAAGALTLWLLVAVVRGQWRPPPGDWVSAAVLAVFALAFSLAYVSLTVGTGALILFGAVQLTMLLAGRRASAPLAPRAWIGFTLATTGFVYLLSPGLAAPPPASAMLMAGAGVAWGFYCLRGRAAADPLLASAGNFLRALPLALLAMPALLSQVQLSWRGVALAVVSGAGASGVGFAVWYAALRRLSAARAAAVQLSVPVLAAGGAVVLLAEPLGWRLPLAATALVSGIGLVLWSRAPATPAHLRQVKSHERIE